MFSTDVCGHRFKQNMLFNDLKEEEEIRVFEPREKHLSGEWVWDVKIEKNKGRVNLIVLSLRVFGMSL